MRIAKVHQERMHEERLWAGAGSSRLGVVKIILHEAFAIDGVLLIDGALHIWVLIWRGIAIQHLATNASSEWDPFTSGIEKLTLLI